MLVLLVAGCAYAPARDPESLETCRSRETAPLREAQVTRALAAHSMDLDEDPGNFLCAGDSDDVLVGLSGRESSGDAFMFLYCSLRRGGEGAAVREKPRDEGVTLELANLVCALSWETADPPRKQLAQLRSAFEELRRSLG